MKKLLTTFFALALAMCTLAACGGNTPTPSGASPSTPDNSTPVASGDKILVGYSLNSMDSTMKMMADYFEETAKEKGWEPVLLNANGDVGTELTNVESLINMNVAAIVIMGCDTDGSAAAVQACANAGIPCIIAGRPINAPDESYYTLVSGNHHLAGEVQGKFVNDYLDANPDVTLNIGFIYGQSGSSSVTARWEGFKDTTLDNDAYKDRAILLADQYAEFDTEKAYNITTDMLQTYPEINCFVTQSDDQAGGIINAIKAQGLVVEDFLIVSIDCSDTGITYLENGELDATVLMAMRQLGVTSAVYVEKALAGESVEKANPVPDYYQLATADNLQKILADNGMTR